LSGKVHDDIANNIYGVISFIENSPDAMIPENKNKILDRLDEIYQLSRNISRESSAIETGENYPEELLDLFSDYNSETTNVMLIGFEKNHWKNVSSEIKIQFYKAVQE